MSHRLFRLGLVVCLAGTGLAAVGSGVRDPRDLDDYSDEQLQTDLEDELDDIYDQLGDPDGEYNLAVLRTDILGALGDRGDEGDETEIDLSDLNAEMAEAGTTLGQVVDEALARADELAFRRTAPSWSVIQASAAPRARGHRLRNAGLSVQRRDKATTATVAVRETKRAVIFNIRRAKGE